MKIDVTDLQDVLEIPQGAVRRLVRTALGDLPGCYSVVFVDDERMTDINRQYLDRQGTTDVIAFPFEDAPLTQDDCAGEIIVSAERARTEADARGLDPHAELALYVVHGALHLAGLDDQTPDQAAHMHAREKEILTELGYDVQRLWKPVKGEKKTREP
ncbi:MAG: rRNA maturation RNase YbeY [Planctomycetota bacterium]